MVKSLHLDKFVDQISMHDILGEFHEFFFGYKSIYDSVLDLTFTSFIVYTYPEDTKFDKLINNSRFSKVSENMWINNWAYLCDRAFYPPFYHYRVYLGGTLS